MSWHLRAGMALAIACAAGGSASAEPERKGPVFQADGTVSVPAFELPPSEFMSPEAIEILLRARARGRMKLTDEGLTIEQARANLERYVAPDVAAAKRRYAVDIAPQQIAGVPTRIIVPKSGVADERLVLINLHGGAFNRCADGCALVESIPIAAVGRFKVITIDYRQGPEHVFPAASEDVAAVYRELLKSHRPGNIGIYGCSAGGALTAQAAAWFADKGLPMPGALGIFSAGGLRGGLGDSAYLSAYVDGSLPAPGAAVPAPPRYRSYFEGADLKSRLVSPALHPEVLAKFPPTLLITGTRAFDLSPVIHTHSQLLKAGADSRLLVGEAMDHCYINHSDMPEARDAFDAIARFFKANLGR